ncbi:MAG: hypothetical protein ABI743_01395 [bacterium]
MIAGTPRIVGVAVVAMAAWLLNAGPSLADPASATNLNGLTGMVTFPDAYVIGAHGARAGFLYRDDDATGTTDWMSLITVGAGDRAELGMALNVTAGSGEFATFSGKLAVLLPDDVDHDLAASAWYLFEDRRHQNRQRAGITLTQPIQAGHLDAETPRVIRLNAGAVYGWVEAGALSPSKAAEFDQNLEFFAGIEVPIIKHWSAVLDYTPERTGLQGESWSEMLRYDTGDYVLVAGYQSREDPFFGVQTRM